tara:strand:+ start:965 stop:1822 length:858 start_codon:yes stop_codon:yes gene_type:complete
MIKYLKYFCEATFVYISFLFARILGLTLSRKIFSYIFKKIGPIIKSDKIIENNLMKLPHQLSFLQKNQIKRDMWSNYGMTFVEYIFLDKFKKKNNHIKILGEQILNDIYKKNKPVIFVSGHFSNFELMSMEITKKDIALATIYRPLNNFFLNPFMEYLRKKYVCNKQIKKGLVGVKEAIRYIRENHSIALMIDQRVSEGEKINFFNEDAFTTTLPAQLAMKFDLDIVPIFIDRSNENLFEMEVFEPININKLNNKIEITKKLNLILEKMIIKKPNYWIWTHDRWK